MIFIVGGAFQGKTEFALGLTGLGLNEIFDGQLEDISTLSSKPILNHLEAVIRRLLLDGSTPEQALNLIIQAVRKNPDIVILSDEIGNGLVPTDSFERYYRETTGRICCHIAGEADFVYRVICGIGTLIKGEAL